jgi:hypothetical protein
LLIDSDWAAATFPAVFDVYGASALRRQIEAFNDTVRANRFPHEDRLRWHSDALDITVAFPLSGQGRPPQAGDFGAQYTARLCLCERFAWKVARPDASLEAEATG